MLAQSNERGKCPTTVFACVVYRNWPRPTSQRSRSRNWRDKSLLEPSAAGGSSEDGEASCRIRTAPLDREKVGTEEEEATTSEGVEQERENGRNRDAHPPTSDAMDNKPEGSLPATAEAAPTKPGRESIDPSNADTAAGRTESERPVVDRTPPGRRRNPPHEPPLHPRTPSQRRHQDHPKEQLQSSRHHPH
ncbi:hypothetical protein MTO96_006066 [Rhipicephalus appendiculatus]